MEKKNFESVLDILSTTNSPNEVYVIDCSPAPISSSKPTRAHIVSQWISDNVSLPSVAGTADKADTTGESDVDVPNEGYEEMLARAWCAENGFNALISRRHNKATGPGGAVNDNRGCCIACSVREARALGWRIVLRIG